MKNQALFSTKDKIKLKCCLLQFLFGALKVNILAEMLQSFVIIAVVWVYFKQREETPTAQTLNPREATYFCKIWDVTSLILYPVVLETNDHVYKIRTLDEREKHFSIHYQMGTETNIKGITKKWTITTFTPSHQLFNP